MTFRAKLNVTLLASFALMVALFSLVFFPLQSRLLDREREQAILLVSTLAASHKERLANEIFEARTKATELRLGHMLEVPDIRSVAVYDREGAHLITQGREAPAALTPEQLGELDARGFVAWEIDDKADPRLLTLSRVEAAGVVTGYLLIDYSLARVQSELRDYAAAFLILLGVTLIPYGLFLNVAITRTVLKPLRRMANTDVLTGLLNRRSFTERGQEALARAKRFDEPLSVIIVDIDHFKSVNDTFGHAMGDKVLSAAADVFRRCAREVDIVGRYGGEEFALALPKTDAKGCLIVAERIRTAVQQMTIGNEKGGEVRITISLGTVSVTPGRDASPSFETLLQRADKALYAAKADGRNRVVQA